MSDNNHYREERNWSNHDHERHNFQQNRQLQPPRHLNPAQQYDQDQHYHQPQQQQDYNPPYSHLEPHHNLMSQRNDSTTTTSFNPDTDATEQKPIVKVTATRGKGKKQKEAAARKASLALLEEDNLKRGDTNGGTALDPSIDPAIIRSGRACLACRKLKVGLNLSFTLSKKKLIDFPSWGNFLLDEMRWR
jgi:hypothetical protein